MAFELRGNQRYYYSKHKHNSTVVSTYVGKGPEAEQAHRRIQLQKTAKLERLRELSALRTKIESDERPIVRFHSACDVTYKQFRNADGWHLHGRAWRRSGPVNRRTMMRDKIDDVHKAIEREKARREFADGNVKQLIKKYGGNAYTNAFECLLTMMTVNEHSKQAFREKAKLLKVALVGQEPSAIVSMMVQRVILGWLDVHYADALFYVSSHDSDLARVDYLDRRRHRAARRLNQAVKCLADVQRTTTEVVHNRISRFDLIRASIN